METTSLPWLRDTSVFFIMQVFIFYFLLKQQQYKDNTNDCSNQWVRQAHLPEMLVPAPGPKGFSKGGKHQAPPDAQAGMEASVPITTRHTAWNQKKKKNMHNKTYNHIPTLTPD